MYAGLLARADAYRLPVVSVADRIGLCVFQSDEGHDQVAHGAFGQVAVFSDDIRKQVSVYFEIVSPLLEGDAEDLLMLYGGVSQMKVVLTL